MRVERALLEQVQQRFELHKKRKDTGDFTLRDLDERILKRQLGEEERKRQRRDEKKEKAIENEPESDRHIVATMGFGGFGSAHVT